MEQFLFMYGGAMLGGFFTALFFLTCLLFFEGQRKGKPPTLHHTPSKVSRIGGLALILAFLLVLSQSAIPTFPISWWFFMGVLLLVLGVGLWDDFRNLHWASQLAIQLVSLLILYLGGVHIVTFGLPTGSTLYFSDGWLAIAGCLLFLIWGCLILNAVNWLDGIDGLCASVMALTYGTLFILAISPGVYQPAIAILLAIAFGVTLGFLVYNYPPARIIGGTSGSLFFGIVIIFVSVVAGTKIATTLLVLAVPIMDTFFVLLKRLLQRRSLFAPDREHLHHILQKRGWSDQSIVFLYVIFTGIVGSIALTTQSLGKFTATVLVFAFLGIFFTFFHFQKAVSKKWLLLASVLILCIMAGSILKTGNTNRTVNAFIGGHWYRLEIADTEAAREQGLSHRESLCIHCGMLFIFPEPVKPLFWMKDMEFSLDILWLQDDRVVSKDENLPYPSLETFGPDTAVTKVLELPVGSARDIPVGARIYFW